MSVKISFCVYWKQVYVGYQNKLASFTRQKPNYGYFKRVKLVDLCFYTEGSLF